MSTLLQALERQARGEPKAPYVGLSAVRQFYGSVQWAWPGWVPRGHVTLLAGPQGTGKSYLLAYLIAVFAGRVAAWPDGTPYQGPTGPVVLVDTEQMRGAYAERLAPLGVQDTDVVCPSPKGEPDYEPKLPQDLRLIEEVAKDLKASAVVIDSLSGAHTLDENSSAMRLLLQRIVGLAGSLQVPVIAVHHARKRSQFEAVKLTLDRIRGSSAISQFCRSVVGLYRLEENNLLAPVRVEMLKASFCKPPEPFGFTISDNGLEFHEAPEEERPMTAKDRACEFLQAELAREPQRYTDLVKKAAEHGIAERTLYRAREVLRVVTYNGWWSLPALHKE